MNLSPDHRLVRLITRLALCPDLRTRTLDPLAAYLENAAQKSDSTVAEILKDQETYALGSLYATLSDLHETALHEGITPKQASAKLGHWLTERLAEFAAP